MLHREIALPVQSLTSVVDYWILPEERAIVMQETSFGLSEFGVRPNLNPGSMQFYPIFRFHRHRKSSVHRAPSLVS